VLNILFIDFARALFPQARASLFWDNSANLQSTLNDFAFFMPLIKRWPVGIV
jgi:hypothetical protein